MKTYRTTVMISKLIFISVFILWPSLAEDVLSHSHGGNRHTHSEEAISLEKTKKIGFKKIKKLIKNGKISKSWANAIYKKSEQKKFKKRTEWVVIFENDKAEKEKTLFIFLHLSGKFIAANFSGK